MSYQIAYLGPRYPWLHDLLRAELPSGFELVGLQSDASAERQALVSQADFVVALQVDADLVSRMKHVRLIQYHGVGYHGKIDIASCKAAGIPVAFTPEGNSVEVAEHVLLLMLAVLRRLIPLHTAMQRGEWLMWEMRQHSFNLAGKTVGIVGLGRIGRQIAQRAQAFDTTIVYHDLQRLDAAQEASLAVKYLPLDELAAHVDILVLSVPITQQTHALVDRALLARMKPSAILINASRGEVVDEAALIEALQAGKIAGAGLDVFAKEPMSSSSQLLAMENVVLTPHVASGTVDSLRAKARGWYVNFERVARGEQPLNLAPEFRP